MQYLYDIDKPKRAAHIWTGDDSACRMLSTGGMRIGKKTIHDELGNRSVCVMCSNNWLKIEFRERLERDDT